MRRGVNNPDNLGIIFLHLLSCYQPLIVSHQLTTLKQSSRTSCGTSCGFRKAAESMFSAPAHCFTCGDSAVLRPTSHKSKKRTCFLRVSACFCFSGDLEELEIRVLLGDMQQVYVTDITLSIKSSEHFTCIFFWGCAGEYAYANKT